VSRCCQPTACNSQPLNREWRVGIHGHGWLHTPNTPAQARRANDFRLSTQTPARRCLQPGGSTIVCECSLASGNSAMDLRANLLKLYGKARMRTGG
jgi:hypothetical protein